MTPRTLLEAWLSGFDTEPEDIYQEFGERLDLQRDKAKELLYKILWGFCSGPEDLCERLGHPLGVRWYTHSAATEPDMHCRYCGKDLA
jgi:hypothetical protein